MHSVRHMRFSGFVELKVSRASCVLGLKVWTLGTLPLAGSDP